MDLERAYDVLLLSYGASLEDAKKAFRAEAQIHHPDRFSDASVEVKERAEERFKLVNEAYQTIVEYFETNGGISPTQHRKSASGTTSRPYVRVKKTDEEIEREILLNRMRGKMDKDLDSMTRDVWILVVLIVCAFFFGMASLKSCATEPPPTLQSQ